MEARDLTTKNSSKPVAPEAKAYQMVYLIDNVFKSYLKPMHVTFPSDEFKHAIEQAQQQTKIYAIEMYKDQIKLDQFARPKQPKFNEFYILFFVDAFVNFLNSEKKFKTTELPSQNILKLYSELQNDKTSYTENEFKNKFLNILEKNLGLFIDDSQGLSLFINDTDNLSSINLIKEFDSYLQKHNIKFPSVMSKDEMNLLKKKNIFSPEFNESNCEHDRQFTKFRVIAAPIPYIKADGNIGTIKVLTIPGINLMGTSKGDLNKYTYLEKNERKLNEVEFSYTVKQLAHLILYTAEKENINPLKIAEFGLGVYLKQLPDTEKQKARKLTYEAFAEASKAYPKVSLEWVIWNQTKRCDQIVKNLQENYFANTSITATSGDVIKDIETWSPTTGEVNNGSCRTVCGAIDHYKPNTTEEQFAQHSALIFICTTMNPHLLKNENIIYVDEMNRIPKLTKIGDGDNFKDRYVQLHFSSENTALAFIEQDKNYLSLSSKLPGYDFNNKTIYYNTNKNTYFIRLSKEQYNALKEEEAYETLLLAQFVSKYHLDMNDHRNVGLWIKEGSQTIADELKKILNSSLSATIKLENLSAIAKQIGDVNNNKFFLARSGIVTKFAQEGALLTNQFLPSQQPVLKPAS